MNTTNGKIAEQSKRKIADALLAVMQRDHYKDITVTQLAQEAGLSRKTFYRLFADKEAVRAYLFENLFADCLAKIKARQSTEYWDIVQSYFDFWEARKSLLLLFRQSNLLPLLLDGAYQYSFEIFAYVHQQDDVGQLSTNLPYLLAYSLGGIHGMLLKWMEGDMAVSSRVLIKQLAGSFQSLQ